MYWTRLAQQVRSPTQLIHPPPQQKKTHSRAPIARMSYSHDSRSSTSDPNACPYRPCEKFGRTPVPRQISGGGAALAEGLAPALDGTPQANLAAGQPIRPRGPPRPSSPLDRIERSGLFGMPEPCPEASQPTGDRARGELGKVASNEIELDAARCHCLRCLPRKFPECSSFARAKTRWANPVPPPPPPQPRTSPTIIQQSSGENYGPHKRKLVTPPRSRGS